MLSSREQKRAVFRLAVDRSGQLRGGAKSVPCQIVNLSQKGFRLRTGGSFVPGDVLHLEFGLSEHDRLACSVQVIYAQPPFLGAVIVAISLLHQTRLSRFIDQVNILQMTAF
jgi:hypothetical protein